MSMSSIFGEGERYLLLKPEIARKINRVSLIFKQLFLRINPKGFQLKILVICAMLASCNNHQFHTFQSDDVAAHGPGPAADRDLPSWQLPRGDGGGGGDSDHYQPRHPGSPGHHQQVRGRR